MKKKIRIISLVSLLLLSIFSTQSVLASESVDDENDNGGYIADDTERLEESFSYDGYSLTTKYDPRESNHLTDIRNQSDVGICWMYAAASTEEQFIATRYGRKFDVSELHGAVALSDCIKKENKKGDAYIGLVHRLDRPVGGIMVFAKTSKAASRLSDEIRKNNFHKTYYAVVEGTLPKEGKFEDYLIKNEKENISYVSTKEKGKYSCLEYTLISSKNNLSLVKINLITGRSHQIRVQFSSRHHPLVGDSKYGNNPKNIDIALFAQTLTFTHPTTKEVLTFKLDLPNRYPFNMFK